VAIYRKGRKKKRGKQRIRKNGLVYKIDYLKMTGPLGLKEKYKI